MERFISEIMMLEIAPAIPYDVTVMQAEEFGNKVLDRFRNAYIQHHWISITLNYTQKLHARAIPILLRYYQKFQTLPENFATAFAAYLLFMKAVKVNGEQYYGYANGKDYLINDEKAPYYYKLWQTTEVAELVNIVLQDVDLWDADLTKLNGFEQEVTEKLKMMIAEGLPATLQAKKVLQEK